MKYKVGDRVRIKPKFHFCSVDGFNNINMKDEFFNEYSRLPYCEAVMTIGIVNKDFYILKEDRWAYKWTDEMIEGLVEEETKNNNDMEEKETLLGWIKESDSLRLVPHKDYEIKHDGDNFYLVKKKKEYPKTYAECCRVLGVSEFEYNHTGTKMWYRHKSMATLDNLMLCRDAYWKIAGDWKPKFNSDCLTPKYIMTVDNDRLIKSCTTQKQYILSFPTEEMRDAFYENFKELIESCKELL